MMKINLLLALFVTALVDLLPAAPALAAAARTFVSAAGNDGNNCTNVATPCRHLATAYAATAANGEMYVLDPANYCALTITGPVSIEGHGWASIAPVSNNPAITINANAVDKINIIGVVLDGAAIANTTGIQFNSGGSLSVRDSVIRNFTGNGIAYTPNGSNQLSVSNTLISDNGNDGIDINAGGTGTTNGVLDDVEIENSGAAGLVVDTASQTINVTVSNSVIASSTLSGIFTISNTGTLVTTMVQNCTVANNGADGLETSGAGATIFVTRSTITGNNTGWAASSGVVLSYGDNNIDGNTNVNSEPPNPLPYK
jgi:Right handed beta helix region